MIDNAKIRMIKHFLLIFIGLFPVFLKSQNHVILLDDPIFSLQARISIIRNAKTTLDIATYIFENDEVSSQTISEIIKANERGVKVRILIDALSNRIPNELIAYMTSKGIRIKVFNSFSLKKGLNNVVRMHAKISIGDDKTYIVGGRNIVNSYFYVGEQTNFKDREIYIEGVSGILARKCFEDIWYSALMDEIPLSNDLKALKNLEKIKIFFYQLETLPILQNTIIKKEFAIRKPKFVQDVNVVIDRPHSYKYTEKSTTKFLLSMIDNAQREILIESPYLILSTEFYLALQKAIDRGVNVQIITNSLSTSDSYLVLPVYFKERDQLIKCGFDIYEYVSDDEYLHTKMFIFDKKDMVIGSYNMDMLSANINTEIIVHIQDPVIIRTSLSYYNRTLFSSKKPIPNDFRPTLLEGQINLKSLKKYAIVKLLQNTVAPYLRDYL